MRFKAGQEYRGRSKPHLVARVVEVADDGHEAIVEVRIGDGETVEKTKTNFAQFAPNWSLIVPSYQLQQQKSGKWGVIISTEIAAPHTLGDFDTEEQAQRWIQEKQEE